MQTYTHFDTVESAVKSAHRLAAKIVHTHMLVSNGRAVSAISEQSVVVQ